MNQGVAIAVSLAYRNIFNTVSVRGDSTILSRLSAEAVITSIFSRSVIGKPFMSLIIPNESSSESVRILNDNLVLLIVGILAERGKSYSFEDRKLL